MPRNINAVTVIDSEGDNNIYINARLSEEAKKKAFLHELRHVQKNHFYIDKPVCDCENEAENEEGKNK